MRPIGSCERKERDAQNAKSACHLSSLRSGKRARRTLIAKQEVGVDTEDGQRSTIVSLLNKVELRVGRIEEALSVERFEVDNLEPLAAANAKLGLEEVNGVGAVSRRSATVTL